MEDPATWGELEHTIDDALREAERRRKELIVGLSTVRIVADALRAKNLVRTPEEATAWRAARNAAGFAAQEIRRAESYE